MAACPTVEHLNRLLANLLSSAEEETLEGHLGHCVRCRETLESLTTAPLASGSLGAGEASLAPCSELLHRLRVSAGSLSWVGHGRTFLPAESRPLPRVPGYEILDLLGQ